MGPARTSCSGGLISIKEIGCRSYQLKINYSETMKFRPGSCLKSPVFSVGGYEWMLFYYTNGKDLGDQSQGVSISFYIFLRTITKNVNAIFDLTLIKNNGMLSTTKTKRVSQAFSNDSLASQSVSGCWVEFFLRQDVIDKYLLDGYIIIMCTVAIMCPDSTDQGGSSFVSTHSLFLSEHFTNLIHDKDMLDVTFRVNGELFQAHKLVLAARSPVFKNLLFGSSSTQKGHSDRVHIIDDVQPSIFKMILHFIYTDSLPGGRGFGEDDTTASIAITQQLLAAADKYALTLLKLTCEQVLCRELTIDTFATSIVVAEQHNCPQLRDACLYLARNPENMSKIALTEGYLNLLLDYPSIVRELRDRF